MACSFPELAFAIFDPMAAIIAIPAIAAKAIPIQKFSLNADPIAVHIAPAFVDKFCLSCFFLLRSINLPINVTTGTNAVRMPNQAFEPVTADKSPPPIEATPIEILLRVELFATPNFKASCSKLFNST